MEYYVLIFIIVCLLIYNAYLTKSHQDQVHELTKAIIAKNLTDFTTSAIIEKDTSKPVKEVEPDVIPLEQADDKLFDEAIRQ